jgi:hypothetical protein
MSFQVSFHGPFCRTDTVTVHSLNETLGFSSKTTANVNKQFLPPFARGSFQFLSSGAGAGTARSRKSNRGDGLSDRKLMLISA